MEKKKRKGVSLGEFKKREVCAILSAGCSRRAAARYVGCSPTIVAAIAAQDKAFRLEIDRSEQKAEIEHMRNIQQAAKKAQYWRAAAWALERRYPDDYAARRPGTIKHDEARQLLMQFAEIVIEEVPSPNQRKNLLQRLEALMGDHDISGSKRT